MSAFQVVAEKVAEVTKLAAGFLAQAAASLVGKAEKLSLDEMSRRLDGALRALRGEDVSTSPAVAELKLVDGYQAVVGEITVNGQRLDTLLSEGSFNRSRRQQHADASELGYRMATREEHLAYVEGLLEKENSGTINDAEKGALRTYRDRYVRDIDGGLVVGGRRVRGRNYDGYGYGFPIYGALFVRTSAESK
jgi:hypothetical protein